MRERIPKSRRVATVCIVLIIFGILLGDIVKLQIFESEKYEAAVSSVMSRTSNVSASRGEILDCNGKRLVYNKQSYAIIFDASEFPTEQTERNNLIINLIRLFEKEGLEWIDDLPLIFNENGEIDFREDSENKIKTMKSRKMLNLNEYASAQNCLDALIEEFELEKFDVKEARKIASVCYEMKRQEFSVSIPYTFAKDVPEVVCSGIMERNSLYKGVDTQIIPERTYTDGTIAPHILGRTGAIDADEYDELKAKGYKMNDYVGKNGIEYALEEYLKGKDGEKTIYTDRNGNRTTEITTKPEQGNTVILTIDSGMQKVAQDSLKAALEDYAGKIGTKVPNAGAVVVLSCKDSSVLACASYPTFNLATYVEDAEKLNNAVGSPLWNRALSSSYACGSTAKPSVAIAALECGEITDESTIYCSGKYTYYDQEFKCEQAHEFAYVDVIHAIDESCNTFFMEIGRRIGIEKMNEYRNLLGLGAKTGVEIAESAGVLDSPEYRATLNQKWLPGYTVQAAIGQAGNSWTIIQLANYVNTIANGGTRYKAHFVKSIKTADYKTTVLENVGEIVCETGISQSTLETVKKGMLEVGTTGYCASYFDELPVQVACKTGTSQEYRVINGYSTKINNGFLIAFAPYDDPEIAIAAIGEGMVSGKYIAPVIADIVEYYCGLSDTSPDTQPEGILIP